MLAIRPVTYEVETSLSPKRVLRKLDGDLIEHRPTINILSQSKFMKNHRDDTIFYGYRTDAESFQIFHHTAKKRDGGSTGFYGKVEKTPNGSRIYGKFRKPIYAYVVGVIWTVLVLFLTLMLVALEEKTGAVCFAAIWLVGLFLMFWDNKKKFVRAYLDSFPPAVSKTDEKRKIIFRIYSQSHHNIYTVY